VRHSPDLPSGPVIRVAGRTQRKTGGFFSSARAFSLVPGGHVDEEGLGGYHIDLSVKADETGWPPPWLGPTAPYVAQAQWGLGSYERYLKTSDERWLEWALAAARHLARSQEPTGQLQGGLMHRERFPHTFHVSPPWLSGMAQGQTASLLVRLHRETGDETLAEAASRALLPLDVAVAEGGVRAELGGGPFYEEYPTTPSSYVLNGGIFALWGCHDVAVALGDSTATRLWRDGLEVLVAEIDRWDMGFWSRYDLHPHAVPNVASSSYHVLHISQLRAMHRLEARAELEQAIERFEDYLASRKARAQAFARKVLFRLVVPRNRLLANRLPWTRPPR
jgi:heparosan-N-sulfate-glucuronate 5-epimerase